MIAALGGAATREVAVDSCKEDTTLRDTRLHTNNMNKTGKEGCSTLLSYERPHPPSRNGAGLLTILALSPPPEDLYFCAGAQWWDAY